MAAGRCGACRASARSAHSKCARRACAGSATCTSSLRGSKLQGRRTVPAPLSRRALYSGDRSAGQRKVRARKHPNNKLRISYAQAKQIISALRALWFGDRTVQRILRGRPRSRNDRRARRRVARLAQGKSRQDDRPGEPDQASSMARSGSSGIAIASTSDAFIADPTCMSSSRRASPNASFSRDAVSAITVASAGSGRFSRWRRIPAPYPNISDASTNRPSRAAASANVSTTV